MPVEEVAVYIAKHKAEAVKASLNRQQRQLPILAADTIVVLNKRIIGKPKDREDAVEILQSLSGNHHKVITGVVISYKDKLICFSDITDVEFHDLSKAQIEFYVDKNLL